MPRDKREPYDKPEIERMTLSVKIRMTPTEFVLMTAQSSPGYCPGSLKLGRIEQQGFDDNFLMAAYEVDSMGSDIDSLIESLQHLKKILATAGKMRASQHIGIAEAFEKTLSAGGTE